MATQLVYTEGCDIARDADGQLTITWDNGNALAATRGAAVDYVDPHFYFAVKWNDNIPVYLPKRDYVKLVEGGVDPKMALLVVGMRKVALSLESARVYAAETVAYTSDDVDATIDATAFKTLVDHSAKYNGVLDQSLTILGLNGISLLLKGHNYKQDDAMWDRLDAAVELGSHCTGLGLPQWTGILYHDALHGIDAEFKARLVAVMPSPLIGHVNGVLMKRLPAVPAGTAALHVAYQAIHELGHVRQGVMALLAPAEQKMAELLRKIQVKPLDWCAAFQRSVTAINLKQVSMLEPLFAFIYGACLAVLDKRATILKSAAFKNNGDRHAALTARGKDWATTLEVHGSTTEEVTPLIQDLIDVEFAEVVDEVVEEEDVA